MARILLRSPYYVTVTTSGHLSAQLALTIDGTLRYTILKNATSNRTVFEIASLARDYIDIVFDGNTSIADTVAISYVITTFTAVDGGGTGTAQSAVTHTGLYGYGTFLFGVNPFIRDDKDPTYVGDCIGDGIIYLPDNTVGKFIGVDDDGDLTVYTIAADNNGTIDSSDRTYQIQRVCNPKYTNVKMVYVNRFGMFQEFYFFLKNVESFNTKSETFKRNIFVESTTSYDTFKHQTKTFDKNGRTRVTLNTDYLDECYNEVIQDIMLSEYVWIFFNSNWRPSTISTNSLTFKTSVNDKLIQYTLEVEFANDLINNIV